MTDHQVIDATIADLGLTVESAFIPFSQSRNKAEKHKSLNWLVTLKRNGRDVLTTEYSAGIASCPGYSCTASQNYDRLPKYWQAEVCAAECESGFAVRHIMGYSPWEGDSHGRRFNHDKRRPILLNARDVIHSLIMDSSVLDAGGFEDWARACGYDTDSRKAESVYRACLELGLKLRAALGHDGISKLQEVFQDY